MRIEEGQPLMGKLPLAIPLLPGKRIYHVEKRENRELLCG
jgi:hypothetical protein